MPRLPVPYQVITASSRLQADAFASLDNPAALTSLHAVAFGFFAEQRYLVPGLSNAAISAAVPWKRQAAGFHLQHLGTPEAFQSAMALGFAQKLGKLGALGINFHYQMNRAFGYPSGGALGFSIGTLLQLAAKAQTSFCVTNPHRSLYNAANTQTLAAAYDLGLGCDLSEHFFLSASIKKVEQTPASVQVAMQYGFADKLLCRLGVSSGTDQFVMGCGYRLGAVRMDVFTSIHAQLGFSPGLQLLVMPKRLE